MNILKNKIVLIAVSALALTATVIAIAHKLQKSSTSCEPKIELEKNIIQDNSGTIQNLNTCTHQSSMSNQTDTSTICDTCIFNTGNDTFSIDATNLKTDDTVLYRCYMAILANINNGKNKHSTNLNMKPSLTDKNGNPNIITLSNINIERAKTILSNTELTQKQKYEHIIQEFQLKNDENLTDDKLNDTLTMWETIFEHCNPSTSQNNILIDYDNNSIASFSADDTNTNLTITSYKSKETVFSINLNTEFFSNKNNSFYTMQPESKKNNDNVKRNSVAIMPNSNPSNNNEEIESALLVNTENKDN